LGRTLRRLRLLGPATVVLALSIGVACESTVEVSAVPVHVDSERGIKFTSVDRFSDAAGTVMRRSENLELPGPNDPIDYDADFLSHGLGPDVSDVSYYAFDVSPLKSAPVYGISYASDPSKRVDGQSPIFDHLPGEDGYNDFWQVIQVLVPDDYEPNSIRRFDDIELAGYELVDTGLIINCPIIPYGSTAVLADRSSDGWYKGEHVQYFSFETQRSSVSNPGVLDVPYAVVRVIFEDNDPSKGMKIDHATGKTRNVFDTVPGDELYRVLR